MVFERFHGRRLIVRIMLRFWLTVLTLFSVSIILAVPAGASDTAPLGFEPYERVRYLETNNTFHLKRTFRYPADDTLVRFLFEELDVNGSMVRSWRLLNLHAPRVAPRIYRVRIGNKMEGTTYKLMVRPGRARYVGQGVYRQDYLPFTIEGSAVMDLKWDPLPDTDAVEMTATLRLRPTNEVLHLVGTLLHPVAKSALEDALDRVIELGRTLVRTIRNHPHRTTGRLRNIDEHHARTWSSFLKGEFPPGSFKETIQPE